MNASKHTFRMYDTADELVVAHRLQSDFNVSLQETRLGEKVGFVGIERLKTRLFNAAFSRATNARNRQSYMVKVRQKQSFDSRTVVDVLDDCFHGLFPIFVHYSLEIVLDVFDVTNV